MDLILNTEDSCRRQEPARISLLVSYNKKRKPDAPFQLLKKRRKQGRKSIKRHRTWNVGGGKPVNRLYNLIQDDETFFPVQYQDAQRHFFFDLILLVWFLPISFLGSFFFFFFYSLWFCTDVWFLEEKKKNHVTPYMPSISRRLLCDDLKTFLRANRCW